MTTPTPPLAKKSSMRSFRKSMSLWALKNDSKDSLDGPKTPKMPKKTKSLNLGLAGFGGGGSKKGSKRREPPPPIPDIPSYAAKNPQSVYTDYSPQKHEQEVQHTESLQHGGQQWQIADLGRYSSQADISSMNMPSTVDWRPPPSPAWQPARSPAIRIPSTPSYQTPPTPSWQTPPTPSWQPPPSPAWQTPPTPSWQPPPSPAWQSPQRPRIQTNHISRTFDAPLHQSPSMHSMYEAGRSSPWSRPGSSRSQKASTADMWKALPPPPPVPVEFRNENVSYAVGQQFADEHELEDALREEEFRNQLVREEQEHMSQIFKNEEFRGVPAYCPPGRPAEVAHEQVFEMPTSDISGGEFDLSGFGMFESGPFEMGSSDGLTSSSGFAPVTKDQPPIAELEVTGLGLEGADNTANPLWSEAREATAEIVELGAGNLEEEEAELMKLNAIVQATLGPAEEAADEVDVEESTPLVVPENDDDSSKTPTVANFAEPEDAETDDMAETPTLATFALAVRISIPRKQVPTPEYTPVSSARNSVGSEMGDILGELNMSAPMGEGARPLDPQQSTRWSKLISGNPYERQSVYLNNSYLPTPPESPESLDTCTPLALTIPTEVDRHTSWLCISPGSDSSSIYTMAEQGPDADSVYNLDDDDTFSIQTLSWERKPTPVPACTLLTLPEPIIFQIFSYLPDSTSLLALSRTHPTLSKTFNLSPLTYLYDLAPPSLRSLLHLLHPSPDASTYLHASRTLTASATFLCDLIRRHCHPFLTPTLQSRAGDGPFLDALHTITAFKHTFPSPAPTNIAAETNWLLQRNLSKVALRHILEVFQCFVMLLSPLAVRGGHAEAAGVNNGDLEGWIEWLCGMSGVEAVLREDSEEDMWRVVCEYGWDDVGAGEAGVRWGWLRESVRGLVVEVAPVSAVGGEVVLDYF